MPFYVSESRVLQFKALKNFQIKIFNFNFEQKIKFAKFLCLVEGHILGNS